MIRDTHEGALDNIHELAKKYMGKEERLFLQHGEQRMI